MANDDKGVYPEGDHLVAETHQGCIGGFIE